MGLVQGWGRVLPPRRQPHRDRSTQGTKLNIRGCWAASKDLKQREPYFLRRNLHGASMEASRDNTVQLDRRSFLKNRAWRRGGSQAGWPCPPLIGRAPPWTEWNLPCSRGAHLHSVHFLLVFSITRLLWDAPGRKTLVTICWVPPFSHQSCSRIPRAPPLEKACRVAKQHSLNFGKNCDLTCCWLAGTQPSQQDPTGQGHKG